MDVDRSKCPYCGSGGKHAGGNEYFANRWEYGCGSFWNDAAKSAWQDTGYCSGLEEGREQGYDKAIADVVAYLKKLAMPDDPDGAQTLLHLGNLVIEVERGEAKGVGQ